MNSMTSLPSIGDPAPDIPAPDNHSPEDPDPVADPAPGNSLITGSSVLSASSRL